MTPAEAAGFVESFARRYVAERESQEWNDPDTVKAQGWVLLLAAADLRKQADPSAQGGQS